MRGTLIVLSALAGLALAAPASAEDTFVGARVGPVGVGVDVDAHRHHDRVYRTEGYDRAYGAERCRTTIIRHSDGSVRKIKRCRD
jgi:hypothetical protein